MSFNKAEVPLSYLRKKMDQFTTYQKATYETFKGQTVAIEEGIVELIQTEDILRFVEREISKND